MPLAPSRVLSIKRYAINSDGVDDYIKVLNNPSINPANITIEAWVYIRKYARMRICDKDTPTGGYLFTLDETGTVTFQWRNSVGTYDAVYSSSSYPLSKWIYLSAVYDRSKGYLYINGNLVNSKTTTIALASGSINLCICNSFWTSNRCLDGMVASFRIYNKPLSADEVLYNYRNYLNPITDGLILWFYAHPDNIKDIDNDGILEWIDLSGNNNHGKIYGATLTKVVKDALAVSPPKRIQSVVR